MGEVNILDEVNFDKAKIYFKNSTSMNDLKDESIRL